MPALVHTYNYRTRDTYSPYRQSPPAAFFRLIHTRYQVYEGVGDLNYINISLILNRYVELIAQLVAAGAALEPAGGKRGCPVTSHNKTISASSGTLLSEERKKRHDKK